VTQSNERVSVVHWRAQNSGAEVTRHMLHGLTSPMAHRRAQH